MLSGTSKVYTMSKYAVLVLLIILYADLAKSAKFPSNWTKCPKKNNRDCLIKGLIPIFHELREGRRDVGIIPLEPWHFDRLEMNQGSNSPVSINLTLLNLDIYGSTRIKYNDVKVDWDNYEIILDVKVIDGPASLIGDYIGSGKVLLLPISGKGKVNITLEDLEVVVTIKGSELIKNKKKYFKVDESLFTLKPKKTYFNFENIIKGNQQLSDNVNKFLVENDKEIMAELNYTIATSIGEGVKLVANEFFKRIPVTELYT